MVLVVAARLAFFTEETQLGIPAETLAQMAQDGITSEEDLVDFDEASIKQVAENLQRPPGGGDPFVFGARSQTRLTHACDLMRYYHTTGRNVTPGALQWNTVMKNFSIAWKALKDKKKDDRARDTQDHSHVASTQVD